MARIITKGLVGLEDMATGTGTYTRATSTGGTQVLTKINSTNLLGTTPLLYQLNNILYVGESFATQWGSSDIGVQINAAYAALPTSGGKIIIMPKAAGTMYDFTTPIVLSTSGKYVILEGSTGGCSSATVIGGVILNYTPTTATSAITVDYVPTSGSPIAAHGMRNLTLVNNNKLNFGSSTGSATGITVGTTNAGHYGAHMENVAISGFPVGYLNNNPVSVQISWLNPQIFANAIGIKIGSITGFWMFGGQMAGNTQVFVAASATASPEIVLFGTEFFNNSVPTIDFTAVPAGAVGSFEAHGVHFERNGIDGHFIDGGINIRIFGGEMEDTTPGVSHTSYINASGNFCHVIGPDFKIGVGSTISAIITANVPVRGELSGTRSSTSFTAYVNGVNSSYITTRMSSGTSVSLASPWSFESPFQLVGQSTDPTWVLGALLWYDGIAGTLNANVNNAGKRSIVQVIASGTAVMTTALIASGAAGATVTVAATGALTTDAIIHAFNAAITNNPGVLILHSWVTANNVNFAYFNPTAAGVTPNAATVNWRVVR